MSSRLKDVDAPGWSHRDVRGLSVGEVRSMPAPPRMSARRASTLHRRVHLKEGGASRVGNRGGGGAHD